MSRTLKINEIFQSIQGESTWAGRVQTFVRLFGCNLKCSYCDTPYAQGDDKTEVKLIPLEEIVENVNSFGEPKSVCITGGEPLIQQPNVVQLIDQLNARGYVISIETNGTIDIPDVLFEYPNVKIVMDVKCPSSGIDVGRKYPVVTARNLHRLRPRVDEIKFVVQENDDLFFMRNIIIGAPQGVTVLISPANVSNLESIAKAIIETGWDWSRDVRMQLQLHKIIWPPEQRRV